MPVNPLKEVFNKLLWDIRENIADYDISFVHRGAVGDRLRISAKQVSEVGKSWFRYAGETEGENTIPFHRIIEIRNMTTGDVVWRSRKHR